MGWDGTGWDGTGAVEASLTQPRLTGPPVGQLKPHEYGIIRAQPMHGHDSRNVTVPIDGVAIAE